MGHGNAQSGSAPVASAPLADIRVAEGFLATILDLAQGFSGSELSFALAPASEPLPTGLSMDAAAVISGTPTAAATRRIVIRASNGAGSVDSAFTLEVFAPSFMAALNGLTPNAEFGPSAQTGVPLTATASTFDGPPPGPESYQWATLESGEIAGATAASLTPDAALYDGEALYCTITAAPYAPRQTATTVIRHVPPVAAGGLFDEIFDIGSGPQLTDASVDFTGEALSYAVTGAGATVDPATGIVTLSTDAALGGETVTVTASNSGGSASSSFQVTVEDEDGAGLATVLQSSASVRGVQFNFDRPVPVGVSLRGDPIVVAEQAFRIVSITPSSQVIDGYIGNGTMKNPAPDATESQQGWDEGLEQVYTTNSIGYDPALNVDPAASGSPIDVAAGETAVFVKTLRGNPSRHETIADYVMLTVFGATPKAQSFRPGPTFPEQRNFGRGDIDLSVLRSLPLPAGGPSVGAALSKLPPHASARMFAAWGGEYQRRLEDDVTRQSANYSADHAVDRALACYLLHGASIDEADRFALAEAVIQFGLDVAANYEGLSLDYSDGAGQFHGYHPFVYFAAFLLGDATLLSVAQALESNMQTHPRWVTPELLGTDGGGGWPSANRAGTTWFNRVFDETDLGKPDWTGVGGTTGAMIPGAYKTISLPIGAQELFPILLLRNGPGGITGYDAVLQSGGHNGAYDTTNPRASMIANMDRWPTWRQRERGWDSSRKMEEFYTAWRPEIPLANWSGVPEATEREIFSPGGAQTIAWDYSNDEMASEPVTDRVLAWSLDNVQFIEEAGKAISGTKSGLTAGAPHWFKMALVSASGQGKWTRSGSRENADDDANRGEFSPTGTLADAAPVFTTAPALHFATYPDAPEPLYSPAPASPALLPRRVTRLHCGLGYLTGYPIDPASHATFLWQRNTGTGWSDIAGAAGAVYDIDGSVDAGAQIRARIDVDNGVGTTTATTDPVTIDTGASYAATVLFESDFSETFFLDWPYEYANMAADDGTLVWKPVETLAGLAGLNPGILDVRKSSATVRLDLFLGRQLVPGRTYAYEIQFVEGYENWNSGGRFRIRGTGSNTTYLSLSIDERSIPEVRTFTGTFDVPSGATDLDVRFFMLNQSSTGGGKGGDLALSYLKIEEVS